MKKLLVVAVVALLVLALVACGGDDKPAKTTAATTTAAAPDVTTAAPDVTTGTPDVTGAPDVTTGTPDVTTGTPDVTTGTPDVTTAAPDVTTGETPVTSTPTTTVGGGDDTTPATTVADTTPEVPAEGIDILWNEDFAYCCIDDSWNGYGLAFENHHPDLDFRWSLVFIMKECDYGIYESLFLTETDDEGNSIWVYNTDYKWAAIIDGVRVEVDNFSLIHNLTNGYVRLDLGDWQFPEDVDEEGYHEFDVRIEIIDAYEDEVLYYAWFTDPAWYGPYIAKEPDPIEVVPDENVDATHVMIPAELATAIAGPGGFANESYVNLFDGRAQTKLCTDPTNGSDIEIVWMYEEAMHVVSYSFVGANDDENNPDRVFLTWTLSGSDDGQTWTEIETKTVNAEDVVIENYKERNYVLEEEVAYKYFKLTPPSDIKYQLSEIRLYTTSDYITAE